MRPPVGSPRTSIAMRSTPSRPDRHRPGTAQQAAPEAAAQRAVHVLLVQRPRRQGRWIANLPELTRWVERLRHPGARIALLVADFEQLHPAAQWQLAAQALRLMGCPNIWGGYSSRSKMSAGVGQICADCGLASTNSGLESI